MIEVSMLKNMGRAYKFTIGWSSTYRLNDTFPSVKSAKCPTKFDGIELLGTFFKAEFHTVSTRCIIY
jgi:hypothetical protein